MPTVEPSRYKRRSFVYRRLVAAGATFVEIGDAAVADAFPGQAGLPGRLALADLSPFPRQGYKGPDAMAWLGAQGFTAPEANNRAQIQNDGALLVRLADTEALLLPDPAKPVSGAIQTEEPRPGAGCYAVPRRDSHAWFLLTGRLAEPCLRKLCGVDLRPAQFPDLSVAQTSVARLTAIVIRRDLGETPGYHLLADSASALYFWDVLMDAMREFHGDAAGIRALRTLAGDAD
jgi:sarcosine oxidase subunit gamma